MINAEEARIKAAKKLQEIVDKQLKDVEERINISCEQGDFEIIIEKPIKRETVVELEKLGYTVSAEDALTYITWLYDEEDAADQETEEEQVAEKEKDADKIVKADLDDDEDGEEGESGEETMTPDVTEELFNEENEEESETAAEAEKEEEADEVKEENTEG